MLTAKRHYKECLLLCHCASTTDNQMCIVMRLVQLAIVVSLALGGHAQTDVPMPGEGTPVIGGCLADLLNTSNETNETVTIQSNLNTTSTMLVVRRRRSSRRFPPPGTEGQTPEGKAVFSNDSREVVVMNLTRIEKIMVSKLGPYSVIISFSSSLSNYYDAGGRVLPLCHYFIILTL